MFEVNFSMPDALHPKSVDRVTENIVRALADMARAEWIRLAQKRLNTTKQDYIAGIGEMQFTGSGASASASVELTGVLPNMIESGWAGGDLRETVLGPTSRSRKMSKAGHWYAAVPFSHATSGASGMTGAPMPSPVYKEAKKLEATLSGPDKNVLWSERLRKGAGGAKKAKPWHSTDLYTGMVKRSKTYAKAKQSSYGTFRMISTNPDTRKFHEGTQVGWVHPGIEAHRFLDEVVAFLNSEAGGIVANSLGGP